MSINFKWTNILSVDKIFVQTLYSQDDENIREIQENLCVGKRRE